MNYGISKLEAENQLREMADDAPKGISVGHFKESIIRTPIVYGKGVKANILNLVKFVDKVPVLPFGSISNRRSMVYIGNLCDMIEKLCECKMSGTFLAGDDRPISTTGLIEIIAKVRNRKIVLLNIPLFPQLLKTVKTSFYKRLYESLEVDNGWSKQILDFENRVSTEEGIRKMLEVTAAA